MILLALIVSKLGVGKPRASGDDPGLARRRLIDLS